MSDDALNPRLAERIARAAQAAQALSETLWEALHEELNDPRAPRVAELSERLIDISATVALLAQVDTGSPAVPEAPVPAAEPRSQDVRVTHEQAPLRRESSMEREFSPGAREPSSMERVSSLGAGEPSLTGRVSSLGAQEPSLMERESSPGAGEPLSMERESSLGVREPSSMTVIVDELAPRETSEIEIRDEREHAPTAWIAPIARLLERYARDRAPFAVLLVELADVERLRHAELPGEVSRLTGLVEAALSAELRPADSLTRESPGRYWLLAPETDSGGATTLAERMAGAVRGAASHRGAALEIAVGIAVCPEDGSQAVALAARADIALYAARAAGKPVA